jgi:PadR family transcriptional regulator PadR
MAKSTERIGEFEELVLLAIIAAGNETTVVEIQRSLLSDAGRRSSLGAIYSALERLDRKEFVDSQLGEPSGQRGGKRKRFYRLTRSAQVALIDLKSTRERLWARSTLSEFEGS